PGATKRIVISYDVARGPVVACIAVNEKCDRVASVDDQWGGPEANADEVAIDADSHLVIRGRRRTEDEKRQQKKRPQSFVHGHLPWTLNSGDSSTASHRWEIATFRYGFEFDSDELAIVATSRYQRLTLAAA